MFEPLNTEWNRKTGVLPGKGKANLLGIKHGIVYFTWTDLSGSLLFLQCDEGVLKKHFNFRAEGVEEQTKDSFVTLEELQKKKARFLKYPFEVKQT